MSVDIRGLQKTTLLDYPDKVACTVFLSGCNFRCPFCYNRDLVLAPEKLPEISEDYFFAFLDKRKDVLDAVVVCGGEPTLYPELPGFVRAIKDTGFLVKLDTNGTRPEKVEFLLEEGLVDFVGMDIKARLQDQAYSDVVGLEDFAEQVGLERITNTLELLINSDVDFELRTTVVPGLHDKGVLLAIARDLKKFFSSTEVRKIPWVIQKFEPRDCIDPAFNDREPYPRTTLRKFLKAVQKIIPEAKLRA